MKYGNSFYMELSRAIFDNDHQKQMSRNAKWLFVCLNEMEQRRCTGKGQDWFLCTDKELCELSGFSINTLKQAKSELRKTDLIEVTRGHWKYVETGKSSVKQPTVYRILR